MIDKQQRIQAKLGFSNIIVDKIWRLYWIGRYLYSQHEAVELEYDDDFPPTSFKRWEFRVMTVDGPKTAIVRINYESKTGFTVSIESPVAECSFNNDAELEILLIQLRNKLKRIFDNELPQIDDEVVFAHCGGL